eukprot:11165963-Lingulodinium_polyedra.AAC.2
MPETPMPPAPMPPAPMPPAPMAPSPPPLNSQTTSLAVLAHKAPRTLSTHPRWLRNGQRAFLQAVVDAEPAGVGIDPH